MKAVAFAALPLLIGGVAHGFSVRGVLLCFLLASETFCSTGMSGAFAALRGFRRRWADPEPGPESALASAPQLENALLSVTPDSASRSNGSFCLVEPKRADLVGDLESVQVLRFISGADPDPRSASASASSASPAAPHLPVDSSPDAFPEPVQTMVWRCRGLCMDCKKACCGKSDEEYDKVKWRKNHRCNYCWTVWKAEHR